MLKTDVMSGVCPGWIAGEDVACMSVKVLYRNTLTSSHAELLGCFHSTEAWLSQYASVAKSYYTEILKTQGFIIFFLGYYVQSQTEIKGKAKTMSKVLILGDLWVLMEQRCPCASLSHTYMLMFTFSLYH